MSDNEVIQEVKKQFDLAEKNQADAFERLRILRQVYRAARDPSIFHIPTRAQYVVPLAFEKVETALTRLIAIIFSQSPPVKTSWRVNRDQSPEDLKLKIVDHLFDWHYNSNQSPSLYWKVYGWLKESLIMGQSYIKVGWKHKIRKEKVRKGFLNIPGVFEKEKEETIIVEDGVDIQVPSIFNMFFSPDAKAPDLIGTSSWIIEKSKKRKSQILKMRDTGQYLDFDPNQLFEKKGEGVDPVLQSDLERSSPESEEEDPLIDIYERWEDERLVVTANHTVLLRDEPNPFGLPRHAKRKPYVCALDYLIINELWQIGEVEMLKDMQTELTTLRRMRTDVNNLTINPMWIVNRAADVNEAEMGLSRPGGFIHAMPQDGRLDNAVTQLKIGSTTGLSSEEYGMIKKEAQEVTGQFDYSVGAAPSRQETATTVQLLQAAGNMRFDIKVRGASHSFMELNYMIYERWKQLLQKPHPLRIPVGQGFEFVEVTQEKLPEYDDIELSASGDPSMLLKDARKQEIAQLYEMINNNQYVMPQTKLKMLAIAAKSKEVEGMDVVLNELDQAAQMMPPVPSMAMGEEVEPTPQGGALPPGPQRPTAAPKANTPGHGMANEKPGVLPFPRPQR